MTMTRKEFLRSIVGVGVGAAGIAVVAGCGDDGSSQPIDSGPMVCTNPQTVIQSNHVPPHVLMVPLADVDAAVTKTYTFTGNADHMHNLTITAAQFTQIKGGQTLNLTTTSTLAHTHNVNVMCVS
jgi:hypothetical protein